MDTTEISAMIEKTKSVMGDMLEAIALIPELTFVDEPGITSLDHRSAHIGLSAPYIHETFSVNRARMEAAGFVFTSERQFTDDGCYAQYFTFKTTQIAIYYRPSKKGSTCQLNLIGYEKRPVYETICK